MPTVARLSSSGVKATSTRTPDTLVPVDAEPTTTAPRYCYRHPDRETGLSCSECGRPICYECMTPAPVGLRCPEHSGKPQGIHKVTAVATRAGTGIGSRTGNTVTLILIGLNVLVYVLELAGGGSLSGTGNWVYRHGVLIANGVYSNGDVIPVPHGAVIPPQYTVIGVTHGEWWRLISSAFLHYGPLHLAMNMFSLYFAGSILEQVVGRWRFVLLYFVSGIAGAAGALMWSPNAATAGASGAIFGILGALFVLERRHVIATGGQVAGLIVLNLVITFAYSSSISVGGHLGGLFAGVILMFAFDRFRTSPQLSVAAAAVVAVASVVVAYSAV
jgi:membrane associated rhomboid family serine protease